MDKNELLAILSDWNFWEKPLATGILRESYVGKIRQALETGQIVVVSGVRRSGKSIITRQTAQSLINDGVSKNNILLVNFEDPRFISRDTRLLEQIFTTFKTGLNPKGEIYLFLDEIQEVADWQRWVRMVQELGKAKIVMTGSNSKLLSKEMATVLTGRHQNITVYPLSFSEFLDFRNNVSINSLQDYLATGGFPDIVLGKGSKELLLTYFEDIAEKDLVKRFRIRKIDLLKSLARYYMSNPSSLITYSAIKRSLGLATDTAIKFSAYLETAYLNFFVKKFSFKVKEQERSPQKVYAIDTGLSQAVGFFTSPNTGFLAENAVYLELLRRKSLFGGGEIFYWKDERHREVDFIIQKNNDLQAIQVCWDLDRPQTKAREITSLTTAMDKLKITNGTILTLKANAEEKVGGKNIRIMALEDWLTN